MWLSHKPKELSKWNNNTFYLISQVLSIRITKQTSRNVADTIFKSTIPEKNPEAQIKSPSVEQDSITLVCGKSKKDLWFKINI